MNLKFGKNLSLVATMALSIFVSLPATAAQLGGDARAVIPKDVQQLIVVDYRAMQNSEAAMNLKARVLPPELKQLETALKSSGLNDNHDVDELAFAAFRTANGGESTKIVGIAQGQFSLPDILASFKKQKVKATKLRDNVIYPMGASGMLVSFLNPTTMVFGASDAIKLALDARDGLTPNFLSNDTMMQQMTVVDTEPIWSILDQKGTQMMMRGVLGEASQLADYDTVKKRMTASRYTMNFNNGVKFNLDVVTADTFTAATMSSLLNAAAMYKKVSGTAIEKTAIDNTTIDSNSGTLQVRFSSSDSQFASLLQSPLFQSVVH
ncbi:hypothetical protein H7849_09920 [Alloacidobacterium dinghuense]|uniref:DUF3352 domain-containing protein n=1 Tax=Alloacidobacterium dinghuense TaxID=2763107 RepID=A0A7G8BNR0_9BACT|nr:hypothetical protein [Alloacidobacterium dinghuense]QNI34180.1 hypothetical protein H7849_09920 [Alloacidobacterium dinghuense]